MPRLDVTISSHSPNDRHYMLTEQLDKTSAYAKEDTYSTYVSYYDRKTEECKGSIAISHLYKVSPEVNSYINQYISTNPELFI